MITVKQTDFRNQTVFGITNGKKWVAYCYPTEKQAKKVFDKAKLYPKALDQQLAYNHPVSFVDIG